MLHGPQTETFRLRLNRTKVNNLKFKTNRYHKSQIINKSRSILIAKSSNFACNKKLT